MNINTDDLDVIAETIKLRIIARGGSWAVYIRETGAVVMDKVGDSRRSQDLPESQLLGRYTRGVMTQHIVDDLEWHRSMGALAA